MASKRKTLCVDEKISLIRAIEKGEKKSDVGRRFGCSPSTLATIWKNKEKILQAEMNRKSFKKLRKPKFEDLDKAVVTWLHRQLQNNVPISGPSIKAQAEKSAKQLGITVFKASEGWLGKFKHRHNIKYGKMNEEVRDVDMFIDSQQQQKTPITPQTRRCNPDDDTTESLKVLKDVSTSTSVYDEASVFGEYIATKIRQMDPITALTVQHHIKNIIYKAEMGVYTQQDVSIIKQESTINESSHGAALYRGVKQEIVDAELMGLDGQRHTQDTSPLVDVYEINAEQGGCIKVEAAEIDMDIGATTFQPMDLCYRINQQMTSIDKRENIIFDEGNDPVSCHRVKEGCVEVKYGDSNHQSTSSNSGVDNSVIMHPAVSKLDTKVNTSIKQHDVLSIKNEKVDIELETGLITVEYVDSKHNPCKREPLIS